MFFFSICSHLVLQVILSVHFMVGDIKVVIGVVVKHAAAGETDKTQEHSSQSIHVFILLL